MKKITNTVFSFSMGLVILGLAGCESLSSVGESVRSFKFPSFSSDNQVTEQKASYVASGAPELPSLLAATKSSCPTVKVVGDISAISQFTLPKKPEPNSLIAEAKLDNVTANCNVAKDGVVLDITLNFSGVLGPVGAKEMRNEASYTYPYFVSVINPEGQIISKDIFALSVVYEKGMTRVAKQDKLRQMIPLQSGQVANQYQIIAGFQLTDDELAYNRGKTN